MLPNMLFIVATVAAVPQLTEVAKYREIPSSEGVIYADVLSHAAKPDSGEWRATVVHETGHFIAAEVRNEYMRSHEGQYNAFYVLEGKAVVLKEPEVRITQVRNFIPNALRGGLYQTYLVQQVAYWDSRPLYICDEWNAYILGGKCALEDKLQGKHDNTVRRVSGALEFTFYSLALCEAIKQHDPQRWAEDANLKEFVRYEAEISFELYRTGREHFPDENADRMLDYFLKAPECESLRSIGREVGLSID